jgi:hypothetical protein
MTIWFYSIQGDLNGWMTNPNDPLDDSKTFNQTGLVRHFTHLFPLLIFVFQAEMVRLKGGMMPSLSSFIFSCPE